MEAIELIPACPELSLFADRCSLQLNSITLSSLAETSVISGPNYYQGMKSESEYFSLQLGDFLRSIDDDAPFGEICSETPVTADVAKRIGLVASSPFDAGNDVAYALVHAGRRDAFTPLHFDWDFQWVVNVCISGRKTFWFFQPEEGWLMNPVINTSSYVLPAFSKLDRSNFLRKFGGYEVTIEAGQGVLFPSLWWHGVRYDEHSVSLSVRFGGDRQLRPFGSLPRNWLLQRLAWFCLKEGMRDQQQILKGCLESFFVEDVSDWRVRYDRACGHYRKALASLGTTVQGLSRPFDGHFDPELAIAGEELGRLYADFPSTGSHELERVAAAESFLFEVASEMIPADLRRKLSIRAVESQSGLPPRRGLVKIARAGG